ncbi:MAG: restriction endonuclease subunit S [Paraglaciecola sp.]|uniref:restriction endonuclease subunit S n=1 Tax=Paraglaciecola sp. TaxID=1920173 RepID=UPI003299A425
MSELPKGWVNSELGDVVDYGKTIKVDPNIIDSDAWILELEDIEKGSSRLIQRLYYSQRKSKSTKNKFSKGNVLYGKLRPYLNKILIADKDGYCSTEIIPIKSGNHIDNRYLFYSLKSKEFLEYVENSSHGMSMPRLGTKQGQKAPFVLAPLNEQIRIADKLDSMLAKVDAAQARLDKIPNILKRFRQSVLAAATSGELTKEWRGVEEVISSISSTWEIKNLPINWQVKLLPSIGSSRLGKMLDKTKNEGISTQYLGNINVRWNAFDLDVLKEIKVSEKEITELSIKDGDLIICEGGVPGRGAVWKGGDNNLVFQKALHRIRFNDLVLPEFALYCIQDDFNSNKLSSLYTGTTIKHLTGKALKSYPVRVPPLNEQKEIVRQVESLFTMADTVEKQYLEAKARTNRLTQSILAKAFRGELVPQDESDEPASELLDRIKAEQAKLQPVKKSNKNRVT